VSRAAINLLKEKEWDPQKRRSAATVEGVSMDEHGTEGVHLRVHVWMSICVTNRDVEW